MSTPQLSEPAAETVASWVCQCIFESLVLPTNVGGARFSKLPSWAEMDRMIYEIRNKCL
jgi:hypothetical protein